MVLPIVIPVVKVAAIVIGFVAATRFAKNDPDDSYLLIGPGLSGKSTFVYYLENKKYPEVDFHTWVRKRHKISLKLQSGREVSLSVNDEKGTRPFHIGEKDREQWKDGLRDIGKNGTVLYVVSAESLTGANLHIPNADVKWLKERLDGRRLRVIITHLDQFPLADNAGFAQFDHLNAKEIWRGNLLQEAEMIELIAKFENLVEDGTA